MTSEHKDIVTRAIFAWQHPSYSSVMLPALGARTCAEMRDNLVAMRDELSDKSDTITTLSDRVETLEKALRACRTFVIACRAEAKGRNANRYKYADETLTQIDAALAGNAPADVALPTDVVELVIAARYVIDQGDISDEHRRLDKALEPFSARVPYDDEPDDTITDSDGGRWSDGGKVYDPPAALENAPDHIADAGKMVSGSADAIRARYGRKG